MKIKAVKAVKSKLEVEFECKGRIKNFFITNKFYAEYNGYDIEQVPEHVLVVPFLASVCPVAWADGADVYLDVVDGVFLDSLEKLRVRLRELYPNMTFMGKVYADRVEKSVVEGSDALVLFSGGVDSLATFVVHRDEKPRLVAVHGADMLTEDFAAWAEKTRGFTEFALANGVELICVRSNFYEMLERVMLRVYNRRLEGNWYTRVMHGAALLGLCAPLSYLVNAGRVYIAASNSRFFNEPLGSLPDLDNCIGWCNTQCVHDSFELSRQDKIEIIADFYRETGIKLPLKVCLARKGYNCSSGRCAKCSFTIVGLELAGLNPNEHGFRVNSKTFADIKENITCLDTFSCYRRYVWRDLKNHVKVGRVSSDPEAKSFIDWLSTADVDKFGLTIRRQHLFWESFSPNLRFLPFKFRVFLGKIFEVLQKSKYLKNLIKL